MKRKSRPGVMVRREARLVRVCVNGKVYHRHLPPHCKFAQRAYIIMSENEAIASCFRHCKHCFTKSQFSLFWLRLKSSVLKKLYRFSREI